ncbi:MAG: ornithine carbamoyltransferase [Caldimonas sp.]
MESGLRPGQARSSPWRRLIGIKVRRRRDRTLRYRMAPRATETMALVFHPLHARQLERLSPADEDLLLENASALHRAPELQALSLLAGKNLCLMCDSPDADAAILFRTAAESLGARVAHVRPSLTELSAPVVVRETARMLARLYDAIECQGMAAELVGRIGQEAGGPVFNAISSDQHPTSALAARLPQGRSEGRRLSVLQAVLLSTIG